jgi:outer membrane autotransporter protein
MAGGRYETGINLGWAAPYVALQDEFFDAPSYGETAAAGAATYALNYAAQTRNTADIEAGLRQSSTIRLGRYWSVKLTDRLGWMHDMPGASGVQAAFSALAGSNFTVYGARAGRDSGLLSLGAEARDASGLSLNLHFESAIASNSQTYTGIAGAAYRW